MLLKKTFQGPAAHKNTPFFFLTMNPWLAVSPVRRLLRTLPCQTTSPMFFNSLSQHLFNPNCENMGPFTMTKELENQKLTTATKKNKG